MARPKDFEIDAVLDAAIDVFRAHGFEGSSADMLVRAMGIGRQSLYDTFGDKWRLYLAAVRRYVTVETQAKTAALQAAPEALAGIAAVVERVVANAAEACLGVNSICEFGTSRSDLNDIRDAAEVLQRRTITARIREAIDDGTLGADVDPNDVATFLSASFAGIRVAARSGADKRQLAMLGNMALKALQ